MALAASSNASARSSEAARALSALAAAAESCVREASSFSEATLAAQEREMSSMSLAAVDEGGAGRCCWGAGGGGRG